MVSSISPPVPIRGDVQHGRLREVKETGQSDLGLLQTDWMSVNTKSYMWGHVERDRRQNGGPWKRGQGAGPTRPPGLDGSGLPRDLARPHALAGPIEDVLGLRVPDQALRPAC